MTRFHAYRAFFQKTGRMRFLSHHDLVRMFTRALRRTGLPLRWSEGFTPRPVLSFPLALGIGIESLEEAFEFELTEAADPEALLADLNRQMPGEPGEIRFVSVEPVAKAGRGRVAAVEVRIEFHAAPPDLPERVREFLGRSESRVERPAGGPGHPAKSVDVRPYVEDLRAEEGGLLWARIRVTGQGTTRPQEIVQALGLPPSSPRRTIKVKTHFETKAREVADTH